MFMSPCAHVYLLPNGSCGYQFVPGGSRLSLLRRLADKVSLLKGLPSSTLLVAEGGAELEAKDEAPPLVSSGDAGLDNLAAAFDTRGGGAGPMAEGRPKPPPRPFFPTPCWDCFLSMAESRVMHFSSRLMYPSAALTAFDSLRCPFCPPT
jgi:hypothetical protein